MMNAEQIDLWNRIRHFDLDDPTSSFPFSAKLAKENGWESDYAVRAIEEYKRFAFLGIAAGHPISPSEDVDQVWHMHLTYTISYWNHFCPDVLKKPFHHQPSTGGEDEGAKFDEWYRRTLESYQTLFGEAPPQDIWPAPGAAPYLPDQSGHWVIRKPNVRKALPRALSVLVGLVAVGCTGAAVGPNPFNWSGPDFLSFYAAVFGMCLGIAGLVRFSQRQPSTRDLADDLNLDPYSIAFLRKGPVFTLQVVIADLMNRGELEADAATKRLKSLNLPSADHNRIQTIVLTKANASTGVPFHALMAALAPEFRRIELGLYERGLLTAQAFSSLARMAPVAIMMVPVCLGVGKIFVGLSRGRPMALLILVVIATAVVPALFYARMPRRSRYGDLLLKHFRKRNAGMAELYGLTIPPDVLCAMVAIFGLGAMNNTRIASEVALVLPPRIRTSAGGCSGCSANTNTCGNGVSGTGGGCGHSGGGGACGGCHS